MTFWAIFKATLAVIAGYVVAVLAFAIFIFVIGAMLWLHNAGFFRRKP